MRICAIITAMIVAGCDDYGSIEIREGLYESQYMQTVRSDWLFVETDGCNIGQIGFSTVNRHCNVGPVYGTHQPR